VPVRIHRPHEGPFAKTRQEGALSHARVPIYDQVCLCTKSTVPNTDTMWNPICDNRTAAQGAPSFQTLSRTLLNGIYKDDRPRADPPAPIFGADCFTTFKSVRSSVVDHYLQASEVKRACNAVRMKAVLRALERCKSMDSPLAFSTGSVEHRHARIQPACNLMLSN